MGIGDEIIASGQARRWRAEHGSAAFVHGRDGLPRWNDIWKYAPSVLNPNRDNGRGWSSSIANHSGARPYINYDKSSPRQWAWLDWDCPPGELIGLPSDERAANCVIIEPRIKPGASPNKQWPHWQALVDSRPEIPWAQMCQPGQPALRGVQRIETRTFVEACSALAGALTAILPDGGLHHAAAALDMRAVVIQGGFIGPRQTGYATHYNLHDGVGCGWRVPCDHCYRAMKAITPDIVLANLEKALEPSPIKCIGNVWLPWHETHLVEWMKLKNQVVDGKLTYQLDKQNALMALCKNFRSAIDIGAHCGLWSMNFVKRFQNVYAFEPVALHRDCFLRNVTTSNFELFPMALGQTDGMVSMVTAPSSSGDTTVGGPGDIPLRRLDDVLPAIDDVDCIKLDCEGWELFALRGGEELLKRCKPAVCVEQKPGKAQQFGLGEKDAVVYLQSLGAKLRREISGDFYLSWD